MKINETILNKFNELKETIELHLSDYSVWQEKKFTIDTDYYGDEGEILVELNIKTQYKNNKNFQLNFKISEEKYELLDYENENGEDVDGESLWRALFFQAL